nr:CRISPR-associated endonuclease Cas2 [uncultured Butyrivibrio sp.]
MFVLITYDVNTETSSGKKRLRKIAKMCVNHGQRVQNSVFECSLSPSDFKILESSLLEVMDKEKDSLRIYFLGDEKKVKIAHYGIKEGYKPEGILII